MKLWRALVEVAFPLECPGCGRPADPVCAGCALSLHAAPPLPVPPAVDRWLAPFAYEGVARELVARLKYRSARAPVPWLASRMAALVVGAGEARRVDLVTWAPTTARRRRARGFDHAEVLARAVAAALDLSAHATLRREAGPPQTGRPAVERRLGPHFTARGVALNGGILLVDDVATTGATLSAAAAALRAAGPDRVVAVTAARTPRPIRQAGRPAYTR